MAHTTIFTNSFEILLGDFLESCTPGYYNNEGKISDVSAQNGFFGGGSIVFFQMLAAWRESGKLEGLEVS